jgi:hypothetical protein
MIRIALLHHCYKPKNPRVRLLGEVRNTYVQQFKFYLSASNLRTVFFWVITWRVVAIPYRRFGTTSRSLYLRRFLRLKCKDQSFDVLGEIIAICFGHRRKQTNTLIAQNVAFLIFYGARPTYCNHSVEVVKKVAKLTG